MYLIFAHTYRYKLGIPLKREDWKIIFPLFIRLVVRIEKGIGKTGIKRTHSHSYNIDRRKIRIAKRQFAILNLAKHHVYKVHIFLLKMCKNRVARKGVSVPRKFPYLSIHCDRFPLIRVLKDNWRPYVRRFCPLLVSTERCEFFPRKYSFTYNALALLPEHNESTRISNGIHSDRDLWCFF